MLYFPPLTVNLIICLSARAVRAHWGTLVRSGVVKRDYKEISINNVITLGTRIRIVVLRVNLHISLNVFSVMEFHCLLLLKPFCIRLSCLYSFGSSQC
jgi:hypothetical protein